MKTFEQLTTQQKEDAVSMAFYELINLIRDGVLEIKLAVPSNQKRFEGILKDENPRLVILRLMHDKPIRAEIERLALAAANGSEYNDDGTAVKEIDCETAKRIVS